MGLKKRNKLRLPAWRHLIAVTAMGSYLAVAGGFPLPAPTISRDSRPFPCQQHRCGCRTAEQCWQHCCCFSPAERRAWARAHGVEAEAAAAELMGDDRLDTEESVTPPPANTSLAVHDSTGCCTAHDHQQLAACCDHEDKHDPGACDDATRDTPGGLVGFHALGCRGISMFWVSCGAVAPLPPPVPAAIRPAHSGTVAVVSITASSAIAETPDPPPKLAG